MTFQDNQENKKVVNNDQLDSSGTATSFPTEPVEDMELNEEQLDIISGGSSGFIVK